jgi:hypothetical protein
VGMRHPGLASAVVNYAGYDLFNPAAASMRIVRTRQGGSDQATAPEFERLAERMGADRLARIQQDHDAGQGEGAWRRMFQDGFARWTQPGQERSRTSLGSPPRPPDRGRRPGPVLLGGGGLPGLSVPGGGGAVCPAEPGPLDHSGGGGGGGGVPASAPGQELGARWSATNRWNTASDSRRFSPRRASLGDLPSGSLRR